MRWALLLSALLASAVLAQGVDEAPRHAQIEARRAVLLALLGEQEADCEQEFAFADCVEDARDEHRDELARLKVEDQNYEAAQRAAEAARRRQSLSDKAAAFELRVRASDVVDAAARTAQPVPSTSAPAGAAVPPRRAETPASKRTNAPVAPSRAALEAQHEADFKARLRSAEAHRQTVNDRNAVRAAEGAPMAPLPDVAAVLPNERR